MGCAPSKRVKATVAADVYHPAPASFSVFDVNSIEEPWINVNGNYCEQQEPQEKPAYVPQPILEKLNTFELVAGAPHSWSEVSKALEDLKPTLQSQKQHYSVEANPVLQSVQDSTSPAKPLRRQSFSFHTLEELEAKLPVKQNEQSNRSELKKFDFSKYRRSETGLRKTEVVATDVVAPNSSDGVKPVRENVFILRDRLEREREGKASSLDRKIGFKSRRDPLCGYPEKCPPSGADSVVLYTTTLRGVRRTFEDCNRARSVIEGHRVAIDERDVSLHGEFLNELRELLGEAGIVPRLFVKGRYIGGVEEVVELNELGRLGEMLRSVGKGVGRQACEGCGGARFVPCLECGGSCKVLIGDKKERCAKCNENGLVRCPVCH